MCAVEGAAQRALEQAAVALCAERDAAKNSPLLDIVVVLNVQEVPLILARVRKDEERVRMLLQEAGEKFGLLVISEVMEISQIPMMLPYVDILQIGARNMQNFNLLRELGKVRKPVLLKRGIAATFEELLLSAEYVMSGGNYDVILCERGIRTFETYTRNTMDISAIPIIHKLSHLPMTADPSHGTGRRDKVAPMARASVAAGADKALSDGAQSLFPEQFAKLMDELRMIAPAVGRKIE